MKFESLKSFRTFPGDSFKKLDVSKDTHDIKQYLEKLYEEHKNPDVIIQVLNTTIEEYFKYLERNIFPQEIKDKAQASLRICAEIPNKKNFIKCVMQSVQPFIYIRATYPKEFEEVQARINNKEQGYIELNRVVTYEKIGNTIHLHHSPAKTLKAVRLYALYRDAMRKLAKIVKGDQEIEKIDAVSWIVTKISEVFEENGFTVKRLDKSPNSPDSFDLLKKDAEKISLASVSREEFLKRFLNK